MDERVPLLNQKVGLRIAEARKKQGLSQTEFAQRAGISRTSIVLIEHGKQGISLQTLYGIAQALNSEPANLLPAIQEVFRMEIQPENSGLKNGEKKIIKAIRKQKRRQYEEDSF